MHGWLAKWRGTFSGNEKLRNKVSISAYPSDNIFSFMLLRACERCVKLEQYNNEERRRDKAVVFSQEYLHCFGLRRRSQLLVRGVIRLAIDKLDARLISYLEPQEARGALEPPKGVAGILQAAIITRREGPVAGESRLLVCIYTALGL